MPLMDGIVLIKNIKILNPEQLILVTSAFNDPKYLIPLLRMGVENFITKPIDFTQFLMVMLKAILVYEQQKARNLKISTLQRKVKQYEAELLDMQKQCDENYTLNASGLVADMEYVHEEIVEILHSIDLEITRLNSEDDSILITIAVYYHGLANYLFDVGVCDKMADDIKKICYILETKDDNLEQIETEKKLLDEINSSLHDWAKHLFIEEDESLTDTSLKQFKHSLSKFENINGIVE